MKKIYKQHAIVSCLLAVSASKYKLKALKSFKSTDGVAWHASVWYEGKRIGSVQDHGIGGEIQVDLPAEHRGLSDTEWASLADATEQRNDLKRSAKKTIFFIMPDTDKNVCRTIPTRGRYDAALQHTIKTYKGCLILNDLL